RCAAGRPGGAGGRTGGGAEGGGGDPGRGGEGGTAAGHRLPGAGRPGHLRARGGRVHGRSAAAGGGQIGVDPADRQRAPDTGEPRANRGKAMLLTIDVGNTNTVLGVFEDEQVIEHWRIATDPVRTADELAVVLQGLLAQSAVLKDPDITGIALCSTVPSVLHEMREMFQRYYGDVPALIIEPGVRTGVSIRMDNPKEVGSDRIMN